MRFIFIVGTALPKCPTPHRGIALFNNLIIYRCLEHLLTKLSWLAYEDGNIDTAALDQLLLWAEELTKIESQTTPLINQWRYLCPKLLF